MHPRERLPKRNRNQLRQWWETIGFGEFRGNPPSLQLIGPDFWVHFPDPSFPLSFVRPNGHEIRLDFTFSTDGGSIPGIARIHPKLTKWYYGYAYLFHDAEYVKRERGAPHLPFEENNLLCIEVIKTLQRDGYIHNSFKGGAATANLIYTGISSAVGKKAWKDAHQRFLDSLNG